MTVSEVYVIKELERLGEYYADVLGDPEAPIPREYDDPIVRGAVRREYELAIKLGAPTDVLKRFEKWLET